MTDSDSRVNLSKVYDALNEMRIDVAIIKTRSEKFDDHEDRLRVLERRSWSFAGVATIAGAALSQIVSFLIKN